MSGKDLYIYTMELIFEEMDYVHKKKLRESMKTLKRSPWLPENQYTERHSSQRCERVSLTMSSESFLTHTNKKTEYLVTPVECAKLKTRHI